MFSTHVLDVLVSYTRDDAFVAIDKNPKVSPCGGVHIRVHLGLTCSWPSSSISVSGGVSKHTQRPLKAMVKNGRRAETRRVWKLRVYEENTVALSLRKAGWRRVIETAWANSLSHSSGGAHALYHSIKHDTSSFSSFGDLLTLCGFQQTKLPR